VPGQAAREYGEGKKKGYQALLQLLPGIPGERPKSEQRQTRRLSSFGILAYRLQGFAYRSKEKAMDERPTGATLCHDPNPERPMKDRKTTGPEQRVYNDLRWAETASEVQQHVGKLVVVYQKRVIAVGTDEQALLRQAAAQEGCPELELVVVPVPSPDLHEIPH
jgi:hypothetical protein